MVHEVESAERYPRRTHRRLQTRERILKAAGKLFSSVGYGATTLNAIADQADIHVTTLFTHFKTKQELALSLNDAAIQGLAGLIDAARGKTRFFDFYRQLVLETARRLDLQSDPVVSVWRQLDEDPEVAFVWTQYERRQIELFADFIAQDYGLDIKSDYRPELIASLMLASSWAAHKRYTANAQTLRLEAETAAAVEAATRMAKAVLER